MRFVVNPRDELSFRRMVMLLPGIGPGMAQNSGYAGPPARKAGKKPLRNPFPP